MRKDIRKYPAYPAAQKVPAMNIRAIKSACHRNRHNSHQKKIFM